MVAQENNMPRKKVVAPVIENVENPWKQLVSTAESLYISVDEQYKIAPKNELSNILISLSSVINSFKKQNDVWETRK